MSRRSCYALPYVLWYGVLYVLVLLVAWSGLGEVVTGGLGYTAQGSFWLAFALVVGFLTVHGHVRSLRVKDGALRRELMSLATARRGNMWLNRDEHLVFSVFVSAHGPWRRWMVGRTDEDQVLDVVRAIDDANPALVAVTMEFFTVLRQHPHVQYGVGGGCVSVADGGEVVINDGPPARSGLRTRTRWWRQRLHGFWTGDEFVSRDELAQVVAQFRKAELVSSDEDGL